MKRIRVSVVFEDVLEDGTGVVKRHIKFGATTTEHHAPPEKTAAKLGELVQRHITENWPTYLEGEQ